MELSLKDLDQMISDLEARLQELRDFRTRYVQTLEMKRLIGSETQSDPTREASIKTPSVQSRKLHRRRKMKSRACPTELIITASCIVLEQHGKPMPLAPLHEALEKRGIVVGGSDPKANLSTKLSSAKDRLYNEKNHGWWLIARRSEYSEKQESLTNGMARLS
jgi:hypothetical protein